MAHEILSVKLQELEEQLSRLDSRIQFSQTAAPHRLRQEIGALRRECAQAELAMGEKLRRSHGELAAVLAGAYGEIRQTVQRVKDALERQSPGGDNPDAGAEGKILLAEYALDFAVQAANQAVLLSMEAVDAQLTQEEQEERSAL